MQTLSNLHLWDSAGFWLEQERILFSPVSMWSVALLLPFSPCLSQVTEIVGVVGQSFDVNLSLLLCFLRK